MNCIRTVQRRIALCGLWGMGLFVGLAALPCVGAVVGMTSEVDEPYEMQRVEETSHLTIPLVGYIFDGWTQTISSQVERIFSTWSNKKIYHISLSPFGLSAAQVANGDFDYAYRAFFTLVKQYDVNVLFRTMHEPNGGRYSRSGDPYMYQLARRRAYNIAQEVGVAGTNVQFVFSVNHWDMPAADPANPSQSARLIRCDQAAAARSGCMTFEDYYPGDAYVHMMGVTFYNRGKATSNRMRIPPHKILYDPDWDTMRRIHAIGKPVVIDEVGTTSVWYDSAYSPATSKAVYDSAPYDRKNNRLVQLYNLLNAHPDIVAMMYFNVDYTHGLQHPSTGEADRAVIDTDLGRRYYGFDTLAHSTSLYDLQRLADYFGDQVALLGGTRYFVPKQTNLTTLTRLYDAVAPHAATSPTQVTLLLDVIKKTPSNYLVDGETTDDVLGAIEVLRTLWR